MIYIEGHVCPLMGEECRYPKDVSQCSGYQQNFMPENKREEIRQKGIEATVEALGLRRLNGNGKRTRG